MSPSTAKSTAPPSPAVQSSLGSWTTVVLAAAMLGCIGGVVGGVLLFGVAYQLLAGRSGPFPIWSYFAPRDVAEAVVVALVVMLAYRSVPAVQSGLRMRQGVLKMSIVVGSLTLLVERVVIYRAGVALSLPVLFAFFVQVVFVALPTVWTVATRAPDADRAPGDPGRLSDQQFFKASLGLFLAVASLFYMHWVFYADTVFSFFGIVFLPAGAVTLAIGTRQLLGVGAQKFEWGTPDWLLSLTAILIFWAATFYYFMFAHAPRRW